jgi:hypothetical protein
MRQGGEESSLAFLIERSAELKRDLVRFAQSPRFERWLVPAMLEAADSDGELDEAELIGVIDRFALQHRLPDGKRCSTACRTASAAAPPAGRQDRGGPVRGQPAGSDRG